MKYPVTARAPTRISRGCFPPDAIEPPHHIVDISQHRELIRSLRQYGWTGRPLVVYSQPTPRRTRIARRPLPGLDPFDFDARQRFSEARSAGRYRAITGSHRVAAARRAGLKCVPSVVLNKRALKALVECGAVDSNGILREALPGYLAECLRVRKGPQAEVARLVGLG